MSSKASCSKTSWHGWRSTCFMLWLIPVTIARQNFEGYVSAHLVRFWPVELPARCSWGWFPWYRYLEISWMSDCWVLTILVGFKIMFPFLGLLNPNAHWSILHVQTSPIFSSFHARELNGFSAWQCAEKAFCKCRASETMCRYLRARARYFRISFLASGHLDMLRWHHGPQCVHGQLNQTWSGWKYATRSKSNLRSLTLLKSWPCSNPNLMLTFPMILSKVWDNSAFPVNTSIKPTGQSSLLACGPNRSWIINQFWQGHASAGMFQLVKGMLDGFTWLRTKGTTRGNIYPVRFFIQGFNGWLMIMFMGLTGIMSTTTYALRFSVGLLDTRLWCSKDLLDVVKPRWTTCGTDDLSSLITAEPKLSHKQVS